MPSYDYFCKECGAMEIFMGMNAPRPTSCPQCGRKGLRRMYITLPSFSIRGDHLKTVRPKDTPPSGVEIQPRSS